MCVFRVQTDHWRVCSLSQHQWVPKRTSEALPARYVLRHTHRVIVDTLRGEHTLMCRDWPWCVAFSPNVSLTQFGGCVDVGIPRTKTHRHHRTCNYLLITTMFTATLNTGFWWQALNLRKDPEIVSGSGIPYQSNWISSLQENDHYQCRETTSKYLRLNRSCSRLWQTIKMSKKSP